MAGSTAPRALPASPAFPPTTPPTPRVCRTSTTAPLSACPGAYTGPRASVHGECDGDRACWLPDGPAEPGQVDQRSGGQGWRGGQLPQLQHQPDPGAGRPEPGLATGQQRPGP